MSPDVKQLSNPFSTGGGGTLFEAHVQASFAILMMANGYLPCILNKRIYKIKLQGKFAGYQTDDMIVFSQDLSTHSDYKLLAQIKHSLNITENDATFGEVIKAAWNDYNNPEIFCKNKDNFALITGLLSANDIDNTRTILEWARLAENTQEFFNKVQLEKFSSELKRKKLQAFRTNLKKANSDNDVSDNDTFEFLKHFHLLGYDLDIKSGVTLSLLHSLIGQYTNNDVHLIWTQIVDEVQSANKNAGTLTQENFPDNLKNIFKLKKVENIPLDYVKPKVPAHYEDWDLQQNLESLVFANLLGLWDEKNEYDRTIIQKLTKKDFSQWNIAMQNILQENNSPIGIRNGHWWVIDRKSLWELFAKSIFDSHLDLIKDCSLSVLSEIDPKFELPDEERYAASIHGKVLKYSTDIRKGIAETLALIGTHGDILKHCSQHKPESTAVLAIREIFKNADWRLWGSLNNLLPTLAEASPNEFLKSVENALVQTPCLFDELFAQEGNGITGGNYMTGLLWALETLAWSEEHIARVSLILGGLSARDPGGRWANRPANSLTTILLPWFPQTMAPIEKRINAVKAIHKEYPMIAWKILINLLPNQHQISHGSHKPEWRNYLPDGWEVKVTNIEYREQVKAYAELAVNMAQKSNDWLMQLVSNLDNIPEPSFSDFLDYLASEKILALPEDTRQPIWEVLRDFINKHRRFADAKWALNAETVDKIERIAQRLTPTKLQNLYHRLFSNKDFDLYEKNDDWTTRQKDLEEKRQTAIQEILESEGIHAVIQFAETVENPSRVGLSLGHITNNKIDNYLLPQFLDEQKEKYKQFIGSFILGRFYKLGMGWVDNLNRENWNTDHICQFLIYLPFENDIWTRAEKWLGDFEQNYWKKIIVNPFPTQSSLLPAVDKLLEVGRPRVAIDCLYAHYFTKKEFDRDRAIKALISGISSKEPVNTLDPYHITEIIQMLQGDITINPDELCKIEWAYLNFLDRLNGAEPKFLEKKLSTQPDFFCELIQLLYRSKKEENKEDNKELEPDENKKAISLNAWKLLHNWRRPPGSLDDGTFSSDDLLNWLNKMKEICIESGHLEVAMILVGHVLLYAPADANDLWIQKAVAEVLNDKDAENIRQGFSTEVHNSRGVYTVEPDGKPERELAELWRKKANIIEDKGYVRFATTLKEVARSYDRDAERIIADNKSEA